jgi:Transcriptional regulator, AbiEi antitoxin
MLSLPDALRQLAISQDGLLSRPQVLAAGLTRDAIAARLGSGRWQRMYPGVYAVFTGDPPRRAELWAAVLRAGPGAMLSYQSAAEVEGMDQATRQARWPGPCHRPGAPSSASGSRPGDPPMRAGRAVLSSDPDAAADPDRGDGTGPRQFCRERR